MDILDKTGHSVLKQNQEFLETIEESWQRISGDKTNFQPANKDIDIQYGVTDFPNGQLDGYVAAYDTSKPKKFRDPIHGEANHMCVGLLNWSEYQGKVLIKFVQVIPEYQKQRIALCLLSRLQREFPKAEIDFGYVTGEGKALMESKSAFLYHATSTDRCASMLHNNAIKPMTDQVINGKKVYGVSLTRDINFAKSFDQIDSSNKVILVLDQNKLSHNYKIKPIDFFTTHDSALDAPEQYGYEDQVRRKGDFAEAEEFVIGKISNLDKYLVKIIITKSAFKFNEMNLKNYEENNKASYGIFVKPYLAIKNHPKTIIEK